jgi:hypothetical protein
VTLPARRISSHAALREEGTNHGVPGVLTRDDRSGRRLFLRAERDWSKNPAMASMRVSLRSMTLRWF